MASKQASQTGSDLGGLIGGIGGTLLGGPGGKLGGAALGRFLGKAGGAAAGLVAGKSRAKALKERLDAVGKQIPSTQVNLGPDSAVGTRTAAQQAMMAPLGTSGVASGGNAAVRAKIAREGQSAGAEAYADAAREAVKNFYRDKGARMRRIEGDLREARREDRDQKLPLKGIGTSFMRYWEDVERGQEGKEMAGLAAARQGRPVDNRRDWLVTVGGKRAEELEGLSDEEIDSMYENATQLEQTMSSGRKRRPPARAYTGVPEEAGGLADIIERDVPSEGVGPVVPRGEVYEIQEGLDEDVMAEKVRKFIERHRR